jgi:hypothetical protein
MILCSQKILKKRKVSEIQACHHADSKIYTYPFPLFHISIFYIYLFT